MRRFRKITALVLSTAMAASLVACGNNSDVTYTDAEETKNVASNDGEETSEEEQTIPTDPDIDLVQYYSVEIPEDVIPEETVTLTVYSQRANLPGEQQGWFAEMMLEKFNVKLNIIAQGENTFATRMESGNLGDIIVFGSMGSEYEQAIAAGMLYDWEDDDLLSEYGSFIKKYMAAALSYNREQSGGTIYGVGDSVSWGGTSHDAFFYTSALRWDVYKEIGYPHLSTLEDLVGVLSDMVAACPTNDVGGKTYGVSLHTSWDGNMVMYVKSTAALYGYDEWGFGLYNCADNTWESCLDKDGMYIRCLKFYNSLYQAGLVAPDSMTQTYSDAAEDFQTGSVMWDIFNYMTDLYNTDDNKAAGKEMLCAEADDFKNIVYGISPMGGNCAWTIGANTEYPELCMSILNWLCSPEGTMIMEYGPQGLTWDYDDDGEPYLTDLGAACKADRETEISYGSWTGGFNDGKFQANNLTWSLDSINPATGIYTYNYKYWPSTIAKEQTDLEKDWSAFIGGYVSVDDYLESEGYMTLCVKSTHNSISSTPAEIEVIWDQVADEIVNDSWLAIYASTDEEFDRIVDTMIENCYAYGYEQCEAFILEEVEIRKQATLDVLAAAAVDEDE